jgi:hypothetical protein
MATLKQTNKRVLGQQYIRGSIVKQKLQTKLGREKKKK